MKRIGFTTGIAVACACLGVCAAAAAMVPQDFRYAIDLKVEAGHPVQELTLPDAVYAGVSRSDLGDLQVFNAASLPIPFALCPPTTPGAVQPVDIKLPIFPVQAATSAAASAGSHIVIDGANTVTVQLQHPNGIAAPTVLAIDSYVIDARTVPAPLNAIRVDWHAADGASEMQVRVDASDDLNQWRTLVEQAVLLHTSADGRILERNRLALPDERYRYLRLTRSDPGPAPILDQAIGEFVPAKSAPADAAVWVAATAMPSVKDGAKDGGFEFDAAHLARFETARVLLPVSNMTLRVALLSRSRADVQWQSQWNGEVFDLREADVERRNAEIRFPVAVADRYWRIQVLQGADSLAAGQPRLELGYRPAQLRFVAQGEGPFLLAYGSAHTSAGPAHSCNDLLGTVAQSDLQSMIGAAAPGVQRTIGGTNTLVPAAKPLPKRQIVLWAILIFGAAALILMALSLLRGARR